MIIQFNNLTTSAAATAATAFACATFTGAALGGGAVAAFATFQCFAGSGSTSTSHYTIILEKKVTRNNI